MAVSTDLSATATTRAEPRATDCTVFTGQMLAVAGVLDISYGLAGIVNAHTVPLGGAGGAVLDLAVWGWVPLTIGLAMLLLSWGPLTGRRWSPLLAIGLVVVSAMLQVALIHAYPLWALLMIMLDLVILDQLTTRWEES